MDLETNDDGDRIFGFIDSIFFLLLLLLLQNGFEMIAVGLFFCSCSNFNILVGTNEALLLALLLSSEQHDSSSTSSSHDSTSTSIFRFLVISTGTGLVHDDDDGAGDETASGEEVDGESFVCCDCC